MPLTMIEPVADAVLAELQNYLPAKITALQPTFTPVLPMPAPVDYVFGENINFIKGYPAVQLLQLRTRIQHEDRRWQDHAHYIEVGVFVAESNEENLARLLDRYARCLIETLHERRKIAFPTFDLRFKDVDLNYGISFGGNAPGQFVRGLFLPMYANRRAAEFA